MPKSLLESFNTRLDPAWVTVLAQQFEQPYMRILSDFLRVEKAASKIIFPCEEHWFAAFNATPFDQVNVVILGQDPYHGMHLGQAQAQGLSFSVPDNIPHPPSLRNIFKELYQDLAAPIPVSGCLQSWAKQGVLLLNSTLTVEQAKAGSHQGRGWEQLTDYAISALSEHREGVIFLLWGSYAHKKTQWIDETKHCVLKTVHPSPLSAYRGFLGCGHFSQANEYLVAQGKKAIDWSLG
jgi:uracil-DNA glycosylase